MEDDYRALLRTNFNFAAESLPPTLGAREYYNGRLAGIPYVLSGTLLEMDGVTQIGLKYRATRVLGVPSIETTQLVNGLLESGFVKYPSNNTQYQRIELESAIYGGPQVNMTLYMYNMSTLLALNNPEASVSCVYAYVYDEGETDNEPITTVAFSECNSALVSSEDRDALVAYCTERRGRFADDRSQGIQIQAIPRRNYPERFLEIGQRLNANRVGGGAPANLTPLYKDLTAKIGRGLRWVDVVRMRAVGDYRIRNAIRSNTREIAREHCKVLGVRFGDFPSAEEPWDWDAFFAGFEIPWYVHMEVGGLGPFPAGMGNWYGGPKDFNARIEDIITDLLLKVTSTILGRNPVTSIIVSEPLRNLPDAVVYKGKMAYRGLVTILVNEDGDEGVIGRVEGIALLANVLKTTAQMAFLDERNEDGVLEDELNTAANIMLRADVKNPLLKVCDWGVGTQWSEGGMIVTYSVWKLSEIDRDDTRRPRSS